MVIKMLIETSQFVGVIFIIKYFDGFLTKIVAIKILRGANRTKKIINKV